MDQTLSVLDAVGGVSPHRHLWPEASPAPPAPPQGPALTSLWGGGPEMRWTQ